VAAQPNGRGGRPALMAHVTAIVSASQVEYRVAEGHGCGPRQEELEQQSEYRVQGMGGVQMWVGEGLADVGLTQGSVWAEGAAGPDAGAAWALMRGVHPVTGEQLVAPVLRLPEEAKLPAVALLDAVGVRGLESAVGATATGAADWARLVEGARRLGDGYTADVRLLAKVASRAGVDLDAVYGAERVQAARVVAAGERVDVRTKGYDLTLTLPKSFSVAWALAPAGQRQAIADAYTQAAVDVVKTAEGWHARATRGHHGGGQRAEVVATSGLLGWLSVDPVNRNGDAHWHAHVTLAALGKAADGGWSALASAGTDSLFSSVGALGGLMEARARAITTERFGWEFRESTVTGRLEVAHVPDAAIRATSTRRADVVQAMLDAGLDPATVTREQDDAAGQAARKAKAPGLAHAGNVVERTRAQVLAEGVDPALPLPERVLDVRGLRPAEHGRRGLDGHAPGSWDAAVADARGLLLDEAEGPTGHAQSFTWRQGVGLVAAAVPGGRSQADYELLLAAALDTGDVVRLPERSGRAPRYTTRRVLMAERTVLAAVERSTEGGAVIVTREQLDAAVAGFTRRTGYAPSAEQLAAVERIVCGGGRLDVVTGLPGTGKTTVMRIVGDAYALAGYQVRGVTTAAIAAEGLAREAGFPARTLASELMVDRAGRPGTGGAERVAVWVVDEAGMVDTRDMARLLERAQASGAKVVAVGDDRQLPAVGIGGWFTRAAAATDGLQLVDVRRQTEEHELAALRAFRAGAEQAALTGYAAAGQVVVTDTCEQALAVAARLWADRAFAHADPLDRVEKVALLAGRREDTQVLDALARAHTREAGHLSGQDATYRLMGGGQLRLAVGDAVVLRRNEGTGPLGKRNGRRAVIEDIDDDDRAVTLSWRDAAGQRRRVTLTPGDVVAGQVATSYLEAGQVQGAAAQTVHLAQGRTVEHAITVVDPGQHAATYVALSRDRASTHLVLSAEAVADTPEELARLQALPAAERDAAVIAGYAGRLHEAGAVEADQRRLLDEQWPELAAASQPQAAAPEGESVGAGRGGAGGRRETVPVGAAAEVVSPAPATGQTVAGTSGGKLDAALAKGRPANEAAPLPAWVPAARAVPAAGRATPVSLDQLAALAAQARAGATSSAALAQRVNDAAAASAREAERSSATAPPQRSTGLERVADEPTRNEGRGHER